MMIIIFLLILWKRNLFFLKPHSYGSSYKENKGRVRTNVTEKMEREEKKGKCNIAPPVNQESSIEYSLSGAEGRALPARYPVSAMQ